VHDDDVYKKAWSSFKTAWFMTRKGDKVGMSRFFGYVHVSLPFDAIWHMLLVALLYISCELGFVRDTSLSYLQKFRRAMNETRNKACMAMCDYDQVACVALALREPSVVSTSPTALPATPPPAVGLQKHRKLRGIKTHG
jgi:hypothetical protein